jgi:O-succinylbenzoic acid--CoA ligase
VDLRPVEVDGSPERVAELVAALAAAVEGGPPVLPLPVGARAAVSNAPTGTAVVIATSGSTGEPKPVALSADALRASARATEARLGGPGRWLLALPAEHVAGVQVIVRALLAGAAPGVLDLRAGFRPEGFAAATAALGPGRRYTSLVPTQLRRILDAAVDPGAPRSQECDIAATQSEECHIAATAGRTPGAAALDALRSYTAVLIGGAALDRGTRERAQAAGVRVVTTYGMSETAGGCVYDGVPLDGVTVELDPDGRILLGGPTLASGYLRPDGQADLAAFDGGRFRTGDLGRWRDGRLEVLGRADDVIITGGEKVVPAAVERVLAAQPGVRAACVAGLPDAEWGHVVVAAVVWDVQGPDEGLREAVRAALGRAAVPRRVVAVAEIPLRGIGKPDRAAVARLVSTAAEDGHPAR